MRGKSYTLAAMAEQTTTDTSAAATSAAAVSEAARSRPRLSGRLAALAPSAAGLVLGLLALGPGIGPGYLLSYDMVFVPRPQFTSALLGTSGVLPRAVPSDAVVAADGREALKVLAQGETVDLVITDLVMPNQDGVETVQEIRRRYPRTKIIAMSGAFGGQFLRTAELLGACATLAKPINAARLLEAVNKVFEAA